MSGLVDAEDATSIAAETARLLPHVRHSHGRSASWGRGNSVRGHTPAPPVMPDDGAGAGIADAAGPAAM